MMNAMEVRFNALVVKEILDEQGDVVIRTSEKRHDVAHEVATLVGERIDVSGAVAAARTPHLRMTVYAASAFDRWDEIPAVELQEKAPA